MLVACKNWSTGQKPVPVPLCQLEIAQGLAQDWVWTSEMTG